jgi:hypothetical protein
MSTDVPSPAAPIPESPGVTEQRRALLDSYWEARLRGQDEPVESWLARAPAGAENLREELTVLKTLYEAGRCLNADAAVIAGPQAVPGAGLPAGTRLGECAIEELVGAGGMGEVYRALHEEFKRPVAVKVLPEGVAQDREARERFRQGVQAHGRIPPHPNIAGAQHAGTQDGRLYLVMEFVPGQDLKQLVRDREEPLPVAEVCGYIRQAALGLAHAHRHGIVHRDIKPSNLMITPDGTIKILDLGLARLAESEGPSGDGTLTGSGVVLGTVDFMAPDQAQAASRADARSDLYSLGCTFYYLLSGKVLFGGRTTIEKLTAHAAEPPPPIRDLRPDVPRAVAAVVHKLLAKKPEDRYPSADALVAALDVAARSALFRRWRLALVAAVLLAALGVGGFLAFGRGRPADGTADRVPTLSQLLFFFQRKGQENMGHQALVRDRKDVPFDLPAAFKPQDGVRLEGRFEAPAQWYLLWVDTNGQVTVQGRSAGPQAEIEVPPRIGGKAHMLPLSEGDPPGVHLLVLVAGSLPSPPGEESLKESLKGIGSPPPALATENCMQLLRGPGAPVPVEGVSPSSYIQSLRSRLPAGLELVYLYPLPAEQ